MKKRKSIEDENERLILRIFQTGHVEIPQICTLAFFSNSSFLYLLLRRIRELPLKRYTVPENFLERPRGGRSELSTFLKYLASIRHAIRYLPGHRAGMFLEQLGPSRKNFQAYCKA